MFAEVRFQKRLIQFTLAHFILTCVFCLSLPQVNSDVVFYSRNKDGTLEPVKVNPSHVGRLILTKAAGSMGRRDITNQYKFPEGKRMHLSQFRKAIPNRLVKRKFAQNFNERVQLFFTLSANARWSIYNNEIWMLVLLLLFIDWLFGTMFWTGALSELKSTGWHHFLLVLSQNWGLQIQTMQLRISLQLELCIW